MKCTAGEIWKHSFQFSIITFINWVQTGMQRQVKCLIAKEILIITFQLICDILTGLPPNCAGTEQMVIKPEPCWSQYAVIQLPAQHRGLKAAQRVTVLLCNRPIYAINQPQ